jgi:hypothetical protein
MAAYSLTPQEFLVYKEFARVHDSALCGYAGTVRRSAAARRFNTMRHLCLSPKNSNPRTSFVIRKDHARVLAITKEFACSAVMINKWETIEVRAAGGKCLAMS